LYYAKTVLAMKPYQTKRKICITFVAEGGRQCIKSLFSIFVYSVEVSVIFIV